MGQRVVGASPLRAARGRTRRSAGAAWPALLLAALLLGPASRAADGVEEASELFRSLGAELRVTGMTFVGSRDDGGSFVLRAERARFRPDSRIARLEVVEVDSNEGQMGGFAVRCERGELDVETSDFLAAGDVHGTTGDGRRYRSDWVRYDHDDALLYTDAPVTLEDESGRFRGDGFRYFLREQRFRLLGHVRVEQAP